MGCSGIVWIMEAGFGPKNCIIWWLIKWQSSHEELRVVAWMESFQEENEMNEANWVSLFFNYTILAASTKLSFNCYIHKNGNKNSGEIGIKNNLWLCHFSFCRLQFSVHYLFSIHECELWRQFSNFSFRLCCWKAKLNSLPISPYGHKNTA